jgi:hypothetical protein
MPGCNYFPIKADPYLFIRKGNGDESQSFVIIFVDDRGIIGSQAAINDVIEALSKSFKVKTMGEMDYFFGCHVTETTYKDGVWFHQSKLLNYFEGSF